MLCGLAALLSVLAGCKGCKNDHPYVPYSIDDEAGADADVTDAEVAEPDVGTPVEVFATVAPAGATTWSLQGLDVVAPAGQVFELGLPVDPGGEGHRGVVAIVRKQIDPNDPGALVYYPPGKGGAVGPPQTLAPSPTLGTPGSTCKATRRLSAVGKRSVVVERGVECPVASSRVPDRSFQVWMIGDKPRQHFAADVIDPAGAPKLSLDADAADRDGDGIEDVTLHVSVEGGGAPFEPLPHTTATIKWFDRPAGMSRDANDPEASLHSLAYVAAVRAAKASTAPQVPDRVRALRALYVAMCAEGGAPRLVHVLGGGPMQCGPSHALEQAGLADTRAYATMGDALRAVTALDRAQIPPATRTAARTGDALAWINQVAPTATPVSIRQVAAVPLVERGKQPAWGALAFETDGKLLVRTAAGVVHVDPDLGDELEAIDVAPWGMPVLSPDGALRFIEAYDACDGVALHATLAPTGDGDMVEASLPIAPLGATCKSSRGQPVPAIPLAWGLGGLAAVVAGEPVLIARDGKASLLHALPGDAVTLGSPRSPDGKTWVVPTSQGILIVGASSRLLRHKDLDGTYAEQRGCTVSDGGTRVACVHAGRVWVATM